MKTMRHKMLYTAIVGFSAGFAQIFLYVNFEHRTLFTYSILWIMVLSEVIGVLARPYKWLPKIITALSMIIVSPTLPALLTYVSTQLHSFRDLVTLYSPFGTTFACLISIYFHASFYAKKPISGPLCPHCSSIFPKHKAFCPNCFKITPEIVETIKHFPKKRALDFVTDFRNDCTNCPHCGKYLRDGDGAMCILDTPFQRCPQCQWFYLDHGCCEWALASRKDRLHYLMRLSRYSQGFIASTIEMIFVYRNLYVTIISLSVLICAVIVWENILIQDKITASKLRIEKNPEYPQLLKYMGYENIVLRDLT